MRPDRSSGRSAALTGRARRPPRRSTSTSTPPRHPRRPPAHDVGEMESPRHRPVRPDRGRALGAHHPHAQPDVRRGTPDLHPHHRRPRRMALRLVVPHACAPNTTARPMAPDARARARSGRGLAPAAPACPDDDLQGEAGDHPPGHRIPPVSEIRRERASPPHLVGTGSAYDELIIREYVETDPPICRRAWLNSPSSARTSRASASPSR